MLHFASWLLVAIFQAPSPSSLFPTPPTPIWNFPFRLILYALNALSGDMCYTKDSETQRNAPKSGMPLA